MSLPRLIVYALLMFITAVLPAAAQVSAGFSVSPQRGCAPLTIVVTDLSGAPAGDPVNYNWGDGSPLDSDTVHTFLRPGVYTIVQTVANANPRTDTAEVVVEDPFPVRFTALICAGATGSVRIEDTGYAAYEVDWGDGTVETLLADIFFSHAYGALATYTITVKGLIDAGGGGLAPANSGCAMAARSLSLTPDLVPAVIDRVVVTDASATDGVIELEYTLDPNTGYYLEMISESGTFTIVDTLDPDLNPDRYRITGLNTLDEYYCFRLTAYDPCNSDRRRSAIACSIRLEAAAENNRNAIGWKTATNNFLRFDLYRDSTLIRTLPDQGTDLFYDSAVVCGIEYCYYLVMVENSGFNSTSNIVCATALSQEIPSSIDNITASVSGTSVEIGWPAVTDVPVEEYTLSRSQDNSSFQSIGSTVVPGFTDTGLSTGGRSYQYRIRYRDACGNISDNSITASTVLLQINPDRSLQWTTYEGWTDGVLEYLVEKYGPDGQLIETLSAGTDTGFTDDPGNIPSQVLRYRILALPVDGSLGTAASNFVEVVFPSRVFFPNAFTPDGDGLNDFFTFAGSFIRSFSLRIFTRWGELIFETGDAVRGWDGNAHGRPAPMGTYVYRAEMVDEMGISFSRTGEVVLIR
jgi:gliding motility-associated-like protein